MWKEITAECLKECDGKLQYDIIKLIKAGLVCDQKPEQEAETIPCPIYLQRYATECKIWREIALQNTI